MNDVFSTIVERNNQGVLLLFEGDFEVATETLCECLSQARELLFLTGQQELQQQQEQDSQNLLASHRSPVGPSLTSIDGASSKEQNSSDVSSPSLPPTEDDCRNAVGTNARASILHTRLGHVPLRRVGSSRGSEDSPHTTGHEHLSESHIFRFAFKIEVVSEHAQVLEQRTKPSMAFSSTKTFPAIFFNLALSHHLRGTTMEQEETAKQAALLSAMRLYELSYSLLMQQQAKKNGEHVEDEDPQTDSLFETLALATLNNLGWIHEFMRSPDKATRCYDHLMSIFMYLHERYQQDEQQQHNHQEDSPTSSLFLALCSPFIPTVARVLLKDNSFAPAA